MKTLSIIAAISLAACGSSDTGRGGSGQYSEAIVWVGLPAGSGGLADVDARPPEIILSEDQLLRVTIHEIGHVLGVQHNDDPNSLMHNPPGRQLLPYDLAQIRVQGTLRLTLLEGVNREEVWQATNVWNYAVGYELVRIVE